MGPIPAEGRPVPAADPTARVLVTHPLPGEHPALADLEVVDAGDDPDRAAILEAVGDVDGLICPLTVRVDAAMLERAPRLRVVGNVAVGHDNVDLEAATRRGIVVCNTPGVLDETTADLAFALILAAARRLSEAERDLRAGRWDGWRMTGHLGVDVHGATLGLVGYGRIGRAVARRAAGFDMRVLHHARRDTGEAGYVPDLHDLLGRADVVSLHVPLTDATHHLIGRPELRRLGASGVLVNTARGPVVDEDALADALASGDVFAAGLDVHEHEPAVHPALAASDRVVLLPHIGSASVATRTRMAAMAVDAVRTALAGGTPRTALNPGVLDGPPGDR